VNNIVFIDVEVSPQSNTLMDLGAVKSDRSKLHSKNTDDFAKFIYGAAFIGGHNIFMHDLNYIRHLITDENRVSIIDTLYLSPLLFPTKPYHHLVKDYKLQTDELNNPLNDSIITMELFNEEIVAFERLETAIKDIYGPLLNSQPQFSGFFKYMDYYSDTADVEETIKETFHAKICDNAPLREIINNHPVELAYCLALISTGDFESLTPPWVSVNFPAVVDIMRLLRNTPCAGACEYCSNFLDVRKRLKSIFGYSEFRLFNGEPLQEKAVAAAITNRSLLVIFPTGGGKSLTFQLPALIAGEASRGLTVVISPLLSLMKDQVDSLVKKDIAAAVTVNGLLNPIERQEALDRVESGLASILYISPEMLRSKTIERLLLSRNIVRFVIDEAHCFSSWGHDFRVDYLYIGDFIKALQEKKNLIYGIPVSCFTATAKQKVISDICGYFKRKLNIELELYTTNAERKNLRYKVLYKEEKEKYAILRDLIEQKKCPTIVYVSRTKRTYEIAERLESEGHPAKPFNGKMDPKDKVEYQEAFMNGSVNIIVATSAFGMGVDKSDVGLVVHYDISDSLENYVQEAGRAGRDPELQADCYVLFSDKDLNKHFTLLNNTKLSMNDIGQIWKSIKDLTRNREKLCRSALEIGRQAGWDESVNNIETRVRTAVSALETVDYIKRGMNVPRVFATGILAKNMEEAAQKIDNSDRFDDKQKEDAKRIVKSLISNRSIAKAGNDEAESRVDYISDRLGIAKSDVIASINLMREEGLLADSRDLSAYIRKGENQQNKSHTILQKHAQLEEFLISVVAEGEQHLNLKEINTQAIESGIRNSSVKSIKNIFYYWTIREYITRSLNVSNGHICILPQISLDSLKNKYKKRVDMAQFIVKLLHERDVEASNPEKEEYLVQFSVLELKEAYINEINLFSDDRRNTSIDDVEDALLYLSKIGALTIEGGFLVLYNAMEINRLVRDNKKRYTKKDYEQLDEYYKQKIEQIHIVGEYANMMVKDYGAALRFVSDYFQKEYKFFISKYFGDRTSEISRNMTSERYNTLFGRLSVVQKEIINDKDSKYIVVAAGPGSGKTRVLVHKLAALYQLEDIKSEQLLMLTFTRSAATEFKTRLIELIEGAAHFIEIKTFHSYCFDLLGRISNPEDLKEVVKTAADMIKNGEVEAGRITKTVLVIDEAQDIGTDDFELIRALMDKNEDMKIIVVGDDDQNILEFRGSDSKYLKFFILNNGAKQYNLLENYRSKRNIVGFANAFLSTIPNRLKSMPIQAVRQEDGVVKLVKHKSKYLEVPIINNIRATFDGGTACVLTSTNADALKITSLLSKEGFNAKLIQSNEGFWLYNLAELRYFMKILDKDSKSGFISDNDWEDAKNLLITNYKNSECLNHCLTILEDFEQANSQKYKTDFEIFVKESKYEDFYRYGQEEILVSTVHKSKGREFDRVYMMQNDVSTYTPETKRKIYVGLTRAKNELYVHYNNDCFDHINSAAAERSFDNTMYSESEEIVIQLSLKDVKLGYFKKKQYCVLKLRSGNDLTLNGDALYTDKREMVAIFSNKCQAEINNLKNNGYKPYAAKIRFIVFWKDQEDESENEYAVILPDVYFRKAKGPS